MKEYSSVIDALSINYYKVCTREVKKAVHLNGSSEQFDTLLRVEKGNFYVGPDYKQLKPGNTYFIPAGKKVFVKHGKATRYAVFNSDGFKNAEEREQYVIDYMENGKKPTRKDVFSLVGFNVYIFHSINFFSLIELNNLLIDDDENLNKLIDELVKEENNKMPGYKRVQQSIMEQIVLSLIRKVLADPLHKSKFEKMSYLFDKRLMDIVFYIKNNLDKKLSNKHIADIACVSEDYVGQLFKTITKRNLQDFIEEERLERAHQLLATTTHNIQEIAHQVGFRDPAYFSRRFKLKFGRNANVLRKEERYMI